MIIPKPSLNDLSVQASISGRISNKWKELLPPISKGKPKMFIRKEMTTNKKRKNPNIHTLRPRKLTSSQATYSKTYLHVQSKLRSSVIL